MMIARGVAYGNRCVEAVAVGVVVVLLAVAVVVSSGLSRGADERFCEGEDQLHRVGCSES